MRITSGRLHLKDTIIQGQQAHIERAATKVKNQDILLTVLLLVKTIGNRCCSRLVNNTENIQTRDNTSILRRLALRVIEIRGNRDDRIRDRLAKIRLRCSLHLLKNRSANLLRAHVLRLTLELHLDFGLVILTLDHLVRKLLEITLNRRLIPTATNQALCLIHSILGVSRRLTLRRITNQALVARKCHKRRGRAIALIVGDDLYTVILPNTHTARRRAKIDTNSCHYTTKNIVWKIFNPFTVKS